jgi:hypothetical protein
MMMIVLLLFLQKQNLATAIYLFGLGALLNHQRGCLLAALVHHQQHRRRRLLYLGASTLLRKMRVSMRRSQTAT